MRASSSRPNPFLRAPAVKESVPPPLTPTTTTGPKEPQQQPRAMGYRLIQLRPASVLAEQYSSDHREKHSKPAVVAPPKEGKRGRLAQWFFVYIPDGFPCDRRFHDKCGDHRTGNRGIVLVMSGNILRQGHATDRRFSTWCVNLP